MRRLFSFIPIAPDGWKFIAGFSLAGLSLLAIDFLPARGAGVFFLALGGFSIMFFRDPDRKITSAKGILSPADGTVMEIAEVDGEGYGRGTVIRIFLSLFNVHIQRAPVNGAINSVTHRPGGFSDARDPGAASSNEANLIEMTGPCGRVLIKQIAGKVARRIVCKVRPGDTVGRGDRLGLIRFGSQVNIYFPSSMKVLIGKGDRVVAGISIISMSDRDSGDSEMQ